MLQCEALLFKIPLSEWHLTMRDHSSYLFSLLLLLLFRCSLFNSSQAWGQIYAALGLPLFPLLTGSCSLMQAQSLQYFWHHPFYFFFLLFPQLNPGMTLSLLSFDSSSLLGPHPKLETDKHRPQFWYFCITAPQSPPWKLANVCSHVNRIFFWGKHGLVEGVQVFSIIRQTRDLSLLHLPWTHFPTFTES